MVDRLEGRRSRRRVLLALDSGTGAADGGRAAGDGRRASERARFGSGSGAVGPRAPVPRAGDHRSLTRRPPGGRRDSSRASIWARVSRAASSPRAPLADRSPRENGCNGRAGLCREHHPRRRPRPLACGVHALAELAAVNSATVLPDARASSLFALGLGETSRVLSRHAEHRRGPPAMFRTRESATHTPSHPRRSSEPPRKATHDLPAA